MVPAYHRGPVWLAAAGAAALTTASAAGGEVPYRIVGDGVPQPLASAPADAARGRAAALDPERGNCAICHLLPTVASGGNVGPSLAGIGRRRTAAQLRLRVIDSRRINPASIMPPYYKVSGLTRVASKRQGRPALSEQEVEDVVAYLATLR